MDSIQPSQKPQKKSLRKNFSWKWLIIILIGLAVALQLERFITQGTIFGYHVRGVKGTKTVSITKNKDNQPSEACKKASASDVSSILGTKVERIGGSFADRTQPTFISVCTYRTTDKPTRVTTIVIRDSKDEAAAKQVVATANKRKNATTVKGIGDEATFSTSAQQLIVRDGKRIVTVTVNKATNNKQISSEDAAKKIAGQVL